MKGCLCLVVVVKGCLVKDIKADFTNAEGLTRAHMVKVVLAVHAGHACSTFALHAASRWPQSQQAKVPVCAPAYAAACALGNGHHALTRSVTLSHGVSRLEGAPTPGGSRGKHGQRVTHVAPAQRREQS